MPHLSIRLVGRNPYPTTVPDSVLKDIIRAAVMARVEDVAAGAARGDYPRDAIAFVVLDRTAPDWMPSDETVLFVAAYGEIGERVVRNAAGKAFEHRDHGVEAGVLAHTTPGRLSDDDFRYGFSAVLDGTYVGASGLESHQDRYQAVLLANELNYRIDSLKFAWHAQNPGHWWSSSNEPGDRYRRVAALEGVELT